MDVLTGVASIAFSLCINSFNSFVQYSDHDYHLISAYIVCQFTPNSPTTLLGLRGIIRLGVLKQYLIAGEVLFRKGFISIQVGIVGTLTSKYISGQQ